MVGKRLIREQDDVRTRRREVSLPVSVDSFAERKSHPRISTFDYAQSKHAIYGSALEHG
jgi:hypothetical protein